MADSFSEVSTTSWFGRIVESIKGIAVGFVLVLVAGGVLFWNEGRAVKTAKSLEEGAGVVVETPADKVDPSHDQKLVHLTGKLSADSNVQDQEFEIAIDAVKLNRNAEMYQWVESESTKQDSNLGGSQTTTKTTSYGKQWKSRWIDSSEFKQPSGHENPVGFPVASHEWTAMDIKIGVYGLSEDLLNAIPVDKKVELSDKNLQTIPAAIKPSGGGKAVIDKGAIFVGKNPASPEIGDLRISWQYAPKGVVSAVARQSGSRLTDYTTSNGQTISLLQVGDVDSKGMFAQAEADNIQMTWILRGVGFFVMFFGFALVLKPFVVLADVVPLFGTIAGYGAAAGAAIATGVLGLVVVAVAWLTYRPVLGIGLLVVAGGLITWAIIKRKKKALAATPA